jgi:hypothetical protein
MKKATIAAVLLLLVSSASGEAPPLRLRDGTAVEAESWEIKDQYVIVTLQGGNLVVYKVEDVEPSSLGARTSPKEHQKPEKAPGSSDPSKPAKNLGEYAKGIKLNKDKERSKSGTFTVQMVGDAGTGELSGGARGSRQAEAYGADAMTTRVSDPGALSTFEGMIADLAQKRHKAETTNCAAQALNTTVQGNIQNDPGVLNCISQVDLQLARVALGRKQAVEYARRNGINPGTVREVLNRYQFY